MTRYVHRSSGAIQDRPVPWRMRLGLFSLLPLTLLLQLLARAMPAAVERGYSHGIYPYIRKFVSAFTEWTGWSIVEIVILLYVCLLLWRFYSILRGLSRKRRTLMNISAHAFSRSLALTGLLYAWGVFGWGFNYQRVPFVESQQLNTSHATPLELRLLCEGLAREAGELREGLPQGEPGRALSRVGIGFEHVWPDYPDLHGTQVSRVKTIKLPLLGWLGLGGVFSPYTSEPNVNGHQPLASVIAAGCHEMAHQAGWAREEEASFVGFAACRRHPDREIRYATTQSALKHCAAALAPVDPDGWQDLRERLHPGILQDWKAAQEYWARHDTPLATAAEKVNDTYLKSQGQEAGVGSYDQFVDLLIGDLRRQRTQIDTDRP
jgi:hypothetical protein